MGDVAGGRQCRISVAAMTALVDLLRIAVRRGCGGRHGARGFDEPGQVALLQEDPAAGAALVDHEAVASGTHHSGMALGAAQDRIHHRLSFPERHSVPASLVTVMPKKARDLLGNGAWRAAT